MSINNRTHGSPYDRGFADFWYHRPRNPHFYPNGSYNDPKIEGSHLTESQISEYNKGYSDAEKNGAQKEF